MNEDKMFVEKECACCGKLIPFILTTTHKWAWKKKKKGKFKYYCSYGCMRKGGG